MQEKSDEAENEQLLQNKRKTVSGKGLLEKHQIKEKSQRPSKKGSIQKGPIIPEEELLEKHHQGKGKSRGSSKKRLAPKNPILPPEELTMKSQVNSKVITSLMRESRSKSPPNSKEFLAMKRPISEQSRRSKSKTASPTQAKRERQKQCESRTSDGVPTPSREPHELDCLHVQLQQQSALEKMKAWACSGPVSMEDDDMFTMFRWSSNVLDDEEIIEKHRGEYEKTQRRDSMKKRMIITAKDIFGG